MAILKRCGNCGTTFNALDEHDQYCGPCRGETNEENKLIFAIYGMDDENSQPPYPWCGGNPTVADCVRAGYCQRDPNCGE